MRFFNSLDDLEADLVEVIEFAVSEFCLFEATGVPLLLTSELVDCWLSLRGRIKPREYSNDDNEEREEKKKNICAISNITFTTNVVCVCVAQEDITTTVNSTCFPYNVKQGSPQGKLC